MCCISGVIAIWKLKIVGIVDTFYKIDNQKKRYVSIIINIDIFKDKKTNGFYLIEIKFNKMEKW